MCTYLGVVFCQNRPKADLLLSKLIIYMVKKFSYAIDKCDFIL